MTRTVVASGYGSPEVLVLQDIELPPPGPGQVLVDVRAAGANPIDYKLYSGQMGDDHANLPMPVGMEASGVVAVVGDGAEGYTGPLTVGDEVIVTGVRGAYADQVLADASNVGRKPSALSFEQAAGLVL
ncbi:MAG: alcohol dehydrogenase catalytic domain-containing protein, partial [Mycolicibacterium sp.]|nr:alcohol dehydrogenase catalytic domain-containing protein [Mycolicibacterium sp.]